VVQPEEAAVCLQQALDVTRRQAMPAFCLRRRLLGPPGAGTSTLAWRLTTLLPAMTLPEAIETTRIHSIAGLTGGRTALLTTRPCRAPHETISDAGLIGGGQVPMPGETSPAHNGVLVLDELPEFRRHLLKVLRQPLEERMSDKYNLKSLINFNDFTCSALELLTVSRVGRGQ
jgi:predicted ATPase with chaperone activity